jgi:hypothetical protein
LPLTVGADFKGGKRSTKNRPIIWSSDSETDDGVDAALPPKRAHIKKVRKAKA